MAKLSSDGKYVTVEAGDALWSIAAKFLGDGRKYTTLASINNIKWTYKNGQSYAYIYVGQKIYLTEDGSPAPSAQNSNSVSNLRFGPLSTSTDTLFATWDWSKGNTESYKVLWTYDRGDGIRIEGVNTEIKIDKDFPEFARYSEYRIPDGARKVYFKVKPIGTIINSNDKKNPDARHHADVQWSKEQEYKIGTPLDPPSGSPNVTIDKNYKLTAVLSNIDIIGATHVVFEVTKDNSATPFATSNAVEIVTEQASYSCTVDPGSEYKVRCYAFNPKTGERSEWTSYSSNEATIPAAPTEIVELRATSTTSVYLKWTEVPTAESYTVQYTTEKENFGSSNQAPESSTSTDNWIDIKGLTSGNRYYFRVCAVNTKGSSDWSSVSEVILGEAPSAPTTWSSTTTAIVGESVTLYWVHNSKDGSSQTYAEIEFTVDGVLQQPTTIIKNTASEDEKDKISSYVIDTTEFVEGTNIQWRIRTAGIALDTDDGGFGDWSTMRTIDIYAKPTLVLTVLDVNDVQINKLTDSPLTTFPFYANALAGPKTQAPIGYHLSVVSDQVYDTVDNLGNPRTVNNGEVLYSKYFDTFEELMVEFTPGNIDLENSMSYTLSCTVAMNSGLTAEASVSFIVAWTDASYEPSAQVSIDSDTLTATIRPYCEDTQIVRYKVELADGVYTKTEETLGRVSGTAVEGAKTDTGERVYSGEIATAYGTVTVVVDDSDPNNIVTQDITTVTETAEVYYCEVAEVSRVTDVFLSVYRREYNGAFTEIASGLDGALNIAVTDPHPALDYARYRIVAATKSTGAISYYDVPGHEVGCTSIIIQWNEDWTNFDISGDQQTEQPPWSGSLLKLPYDIDVSESNSPDVSFVEYIGREHPVSYYGTHKGETASWGTNIPKSDKETIYALRRLAKWMDNVYVREPSGVGYWANVKVNFSQRHCDLIVPVSLTIRRVEGGV